MNASTSLFLRALTLPALLLIGCGGSGGSTNHDLAGSTGDMSAVTGCTTVATWPNDMLQVIGISAPVNGVDFLTAAYGTRPNTNAALVDQLGAEIWDPTAGPHFTAPQTFTFSSADKYNTCTGCLSLMIADDPTQDFGATGTFYFAQSGTMTVTKADRDATSGAFAATGSNIKLVQWSYYDSAASDSAITGGTCYDIGSFSFSGTYSNSVDGGTDAL
jgi:hypothetical protein